ncbi:MAG: DDE-type integrase/transposase/recombinase [Acetobacteraceae bacterium]
MRTSSAAACHRTNCYLNNRLEHDHRGIKGRCRPMLGFKSVPSATRYCRGHDELRNLLCSRSHMCQHVPAVTRRFHYMRRTAHRARYSGSCLNGRLCRPRMSFRAGSKADKTN